MRKNLILIILVISMSALGLHAAEVIKLEKKAQSKTTRFQAADLETSLGLDASDTLKVEKVIEKKALNKVYTRYTQYYNGIPVVGYQPVIIKDAKGTITGYSGEIVRGIDRDVPPVRALRADVDVLALMKQQYIEENGSSKNIADYIFKQESMRKVIYVKKGRAHECYEVTFFIAQIKDGQLTAQPLMYVDSNSLKVIFEYDNLKHVISGGPGGNKKSGRYVYNKDIPGFEVDVVGDTAYLRTTKTLSNGQNFTIAAYDYNQTMQTGQLHTFTLPENNHGAINEGFGPLNDAYYFANVTVDMFDQWYSDKVVNVPGNYLKVNVHYGYQYDNAFWNGEEITFGDGHLKFYPIVCLDVIAHELGHGFTTQYSNLAYYRQSGGINESFSDMSGKAAEYFARGTVDWDIGDDVVKRDGALRYMDSPSLDGHSIEHVTDYYDGIDVHHSSGVFNKVFFLLATTAGWDVKKAFDVFVLANQGLWTANETYETAAADVLQAATDLQYDTQAVINAFNQVGIVLGTPSPVMAAADPVLMAQPMQSSVMETVVEYDNIALGKPVTISSEYNWGFTGSYAVDNNMQTMWASAVTSTPEWIYVDLGQVESISGVGIKWNNYYFAQQYAVQYSNDAVTWTDAYVENNGTAGEKTHMIDMTCRYVRIYGTQKNYIFFAIDELEVYKPQGQTVTIADSNLEAAIRNVLDKPTGPILNVDLEAITGLYVPNQGITSLAGLEYCVNLQWLTLTDNNISDISQLAFLSNLEGLWLGGNNISDVSAVAGLLLLDTLVISNNQIADIIPLSALTELTNLRAEGNQILDIGVISQFTKLILLDVRNNGMTIDQNPGQGGINFNVIKPLIDNDINIDWVEGNNTFATIVKFKDRALEGLVKEALGIVNGDIYSFQAETVLELVVPRDYPLNDLTGIEQCSNLAKLHLNSSVQTYQSIGLLTNLEDLAIKDNSNITDLSMLSGNTVIKRLSLISTSGITDWSVIGTLTGLESLTLMSNGISSFSILGTGLVNLVELDLSGNLVLDISPLSVYTGLQVLKINYVFDPAVTPDLTPLANLVNLTTLELQYNRLTDLTALSGLANLTTLYLQTNSIVDLAPLSTVTTLTTLELYDNQVVDLSPLSTLVNLTKLNAEKNNIVSVAPLASCTMIQELTIERNQITSLTGLGSLTNMTILEADSNQITDCSALSTATSLTYLDIRSNQLTDISAISSLLNLKTVYLSRNAITDITPFNAIISANMLETVWVEHNNMDVKPGTANRGVIDALLANNVNVDWEYGNITQ